jgi:hypothetical protein
MVKNKKMVGVSEVIASLALISVAFLIFIYYRWAIGSMSGLFNWSDTYGLIFNLNDTASEIIFLAGSPILIFITLYFADSCLGRVLSGLIIGREKFKKVDRWMLFVLCSLIICHIPSILVMLVFPDIKIIYLFEGLIPLVIFVISIIGFYIYERKQ